MKKTVLIPALVLACLIFLPPTALARDYHFNNSQVHFNLPDNWTRIMQTSGDAESMVFEAPQSMQPGNDALTHISLSSVPVESLINFQQVLSERLKQAQALDGFDFDEKRSSATHLFYTAYNGNICQAYNERNLFLDDFAISIRCVHQDKGKAQAKLDKVCNDVAHSIDVTTGK